MDVCHGGFFAHFGRSGSAMSMIASVGIKISRKTACAALQGPERRVGGRGGWERCPTRGGGGPSPMVGGYGATSSRGSPWVSCWESRAPAPSSSSSSASQNRWDPRSPSCAAPAIARRCLAMPLTHTARPYLTNLDEHGHEPAALVEWAVAARGPELAPGTHPARECAGGRVCWQGLHRHAPQAGTSPCQPSEHSHGRLGSAREGGGMWQSGWGVRWGP
jgi:hypothetical protein